MENLSLPWCFYLSVFMGLILRNIFIVMTFLNHSYWLFISYYLRFTFSTLIWNLLLSLASVYIEYVDGTFPVVPELHQLGIHWPDRNMGHLQVGDWLLGNEWQRFPWGGILCMRDHLYPNLVIWVALVISLSTVKFCKRDIKRNSLEGKSLL